MEPSTRLAQRILDYYDDMPRGERKLAELATVLKATTTRFFQRLGYQSFKTAQKAAREQGADP